MQNLIKNFSIEFSYVEVNKKHNYTLKVIHKTLPVKFVDRLELLDKDDDFALTYLTKKIYNLIYLTVNKSKETIPFVVGKDTVIYTPVYDKKLNKWYTILKDGTKKYEQ